VRRYVRGIGSEDGKAEEDDRAMESDSVDADYYRYSAGCGYDAGLVEFYVGAVAMFAAQM
jgi:hypothetical protein